MTRFLIDHGNVAFAPIDTGTAALPAVVRARLTSGDATQKHRAIDIQPEQSA